MDNYTAITFSDDRYKNVITANEAKEISNAKEKDSRNKLRDYVFKEIKKAAENGKTSCYIYYNNISFDNVRKVCEDLRELGYSVPKRDVKYYRENYFLLSPDSLATFLIAW